MGCGKGSGLESRRVIRIVAAHFLLQTHVGLAEFLDIGEARRHDDRVKTARCHWGGPLDSSEQIRERIVVPVFGRVGGGLKLRYRDPIIR